MMNKPTKLMIISVSASLLLSTGLISMDTEGVYRLGGIHAEAASVTYYKTTSNLNMRSGTSTKKSIIMTIPKGKQVTYISKSGSWFKVKYGSKTGYVSSSYLKKVQAATTATASKTSTATVKTVYKTTANLNLRSKASTSGKVLITIPKGKEVTYISRSGSWYKVKYGSKTGYVSSSYLKKGGAATTTTVSKTETTTKTVYTTTSNLNLRSKASTSGKVLITIPKGKEVAYISKSGSWFKVKYGSKTGYVSSKYIKKTTKKTTTPSTSVKITKITPTTYETKANLQMRSSASAKGKLLLTIPKGKRVVSKERAGEWYKVTYGGKTGWVLDDYLKEYNAYSTTALTYYSTKASVGIYENPNTKKKQIYTLPKDYLLTSTQKVVNSIGQTWYRVSYNKKNYFILSTNVTSKKAAAMEKTRFKSVQNTNLYSSAGTAHPKIANIAKGTVITVSYKIGDWYEIILNGKKGYVMSQHFEEYKPSAIPENRPDGQVINEGTYYVIVDKSLNLRESDSTDSAKLDEIPANTAVTSAFKTKTGWYEVNYKNKTGYVSGQYLITKAEYDRYKSLLNTKNSYLTLDLRKESSVTAAQINGYIDGYVKRTGRASVLTNKGQAFINAGKKYGVNAAYLAAHAVHESGYGTSAISLAKNNLFGFGAYDLAPFVGAVRFATIEENINYIAREIKATYLTQGNWKYKGPTLGYTVKNVNGARVDLLSTGMNFYYASDSGWGAKIASHMNNILSYSNEKAVSRKPDTRIISAPERPSGKDVFPSGILASAKTSIKLYAAKGSTDKVAVTMKKGETFNLLEKWNDNWFKIQYKGKAYYTNAISLSRYNNFMNVYNLAHITTNSLNVRADAGTGYNKVATLSNYTYVELVLDKSKKPVTKNNWYQVKLSNGKTGWVSGLYIARDLIE
ncbi:hypothetical protein CYL18_06360 [Pradoshia eiseniae]|uniref:SH3b domain-containing protein n=1 Tax=Pradoshia eiseniae TaxID=2064768 RepID=A0A2S7N2I1_9BACI|nr:SH3 domain-containing protein [Pradoshia eiseniae]PQD96216.1 hypothetical protein CYL18_06360 [Pradoshia eiseniae]